MSDNWLILIPTPPEYVPSKDARERAIALFRRIAPDGHEIEVELSKRPRLIGRGTNLERIICPSCQRELAIDWWSDWMSQEEELGCPLNPAALPCCGSVHSLADLVYDWPQGFSRFSIGAMNPNIQDLPRTVQREFEAIMGCSVQKIWRHL